MIRNLVSSIDHPVSCSEYGIVCFGDILKVHAAPRGMKDGKKSIVPQLFIL